MITLSNGHKIDFACASGALGFKNGWPWHVPLRLLGLLPKVTPIIKTLTYEPRKGNLNLLSVKDWFTLHRHCIARVRVKGKMVNVNRVGLSNPGERYWIDHIYPSVERSGVPTIASLMAKDAEEAKNMAFLINKCRALKGIEINYSCPNVDHESGVSQAVEIVDAFASETDLPLGIKLAYQQPYKQIAIELQGKVEWLTLINTIPWDILYPGVPSPFVGYGPEPGGVSGEEIYPYAIEAIGKVRAAGVKTPIMACGGITKPSHVYGFGVAGANAFQIGVLYKDDPLAVRGLVNECRRRMKSVCLTEAQNRELFPRSRVQA